MVENRHVLSANEYFLMVRSDSMNYKADWTHRFQTRLQTVRRYVIAALRWARLRYKSKQERPVRA